MARYQDRKDAEDVNERDSTIQKDYTKLTVEKFDGRYYLIASEIYDLSGGGKCLSDGEKKSLPFNLTYSGPEVKFKTDEKTAYEILLRIISNANKLQDAQYYSFILGSLCFFNIKIIKIPHTCDIRK